MIGNDHGGLAFRYFVARNDNLGVVHLHKYELNPSPAAPSNGAGEPIRQQRVQRPQQEQEGKEQILDEEGEGPGRDEDDATQVMEELDEHVVGHGASAMMMAAATIMAIVSPVISQSSQSSQRRPHNQSMLDPMVQIRMIKILRSVGVRCREETRRVAMGSSSCAQVQH